MTKREITNSPINLGKIKKHLRIFSDLDDEYIEDLAIDAVNYIEARIGENINTYKNTITGSFEKGTVINLPKFKSLISVKESGVASENYILNDNSITLTVVFSDLEIVYVETITEMKFSNSAINLIVANWYENRENPGANNNAEASLNALIGLYSNPVK